MRHQLLLLSLIGLLLSSCKPKAPDNSAIQAEVQSYLDTYNAEYQKLTYADQKAQWLLNTHIVEGDTTDQHTASVADEALQTYTGSVANIDSVKKFMAMKEKLTPLLRLKYHNSLADAVADLGKPDEIGRVFAGFQKYLYQVAA